MLICRLLTTIVLTILHPIINSSNENSLISREFLHTNVGKRVRMDCELNNSTTNGYRNGLWLRLDDAEVFFYSKTRIYSDERFQIDQRSTFHMINSTSSYELITYSLIIDDVHLSDGGTYSCQKDNKIIKLFVLNIVERPHFITHDYSTSLRIKEGKNLSIECEAQGRPKPDIYWIKKESENNQTTVAKCSTETSICQLNFVHINRSDHGMYECVAMNIAGTVGRFYKIDVQFSPNIHCLKEKVHHAANDSIILQCFIDANPAPDIRWLHRLPNDINQDVDLSKTSHQERIHNYDNRQDTEYWHIKQEQLNSTRWKTSLFIKHLSNHLIHSNIICRATNRLGTNERSMKINEKYYSSKRNRHKTVTSPQYVSDVLNNQSQSHLSSTTTYVSSEYTNDIRSLSKTIYPCLYYLFTLGFYTFFSYLQF